MGMSGLGSLVVGRIFDGVGNFRAGSTDFVPRFCTAHISRRIVGAQSWDLPMTLRFSVWLVFCLVLQRGASSHFCYGQTDGCCAASTMSGCLPRGCKSWRMDDRTTEMRHDQTGNPAVKLQRIKPVN